MLPDVVTYKEISKRIGEAILSSSIPRKDIAAQLRRTDGWVDHLVKGRRKPPIDLLPKLSALLGLRFVLELVEDDGRELVWTPASSAPVARAIAAMEPERAEAAATLLGALQAAPVSAIQAATTLIAHARPPEVVAPAADPDAAELTRRLNAASPHVQKGILAMLRQLSSAPVAEESEQLPG